MADDPTTPAEPPATGDDGTTDTLGDAGKRALEQERNARREAEKQLREMQAQLKAIEDKDKTETEKLREELDQIRAAHADATAKALRAEVAISKGLTAAQAKRLVGSTLEELEADADEIIEAFPVQTSSKPPSERPAPDLRGGTDPTDETVDIKALVDSIPPTA